MSINNGNGQDQKPAVVISCSYPPPVDGEDTTYIIHREVVTLFHEFGHCMQMILSNVEYSSLRDFINLPWDVIELPSTLFENFAKQSTVLKKISKHKETGEPLTEDQVKKLNAMVDCMPACDEMNILIFAWFDLRLHYEYDVSKKSQVRDLKAETENLIFTYPSYYRRENHFRHPFMKDYDSLDNCGYASRYYSYIWSRIITKEVWVRFKKEGVLKKEVAMDFKKIILESMFTKEPLELVNEFLKRPQDQMVTMDAYLKKFRKNVDKPLLEFTLFKQDENSEIAKDKVCQVNINKP